MSYKEKKAAARQEIIQFFSEVFEQELSWNELAYYQTQIEIIAKKFGLVRELKNEGIL